MVELYIFLFLEFSFTALFFLSIMNYISHNKPGAVKFFSIKGQIVSIVGFAGCTTSFTTTELCCRSVKATVGNM